MFNMNKTDECLTSLPSTEKAEDIKQAMTMTSSTLAIYKAIMIITHALTISLYFIFYTQHRCMMLRINETDVIIIFFLLSVITKYVINYVITVELCKSNFSNITFAKLNLLNAMLKQSHITVLISHQLYFTLFMFVFRPDTGHTTRGCNTDIRS